MKFGEKTNTFLLMEPDEFEQYVINNREDLGDNSRREGFLKQESLVNEITPPMTVTPPTMFMILGDV
jgi:hypothetical protein